MRSTIIHTLIPATILLLAGALSGQSSTKPDRLSGPDAGRRTAIFVDDVTTFARADPTTAPAAAAAATTQPAGQADAEAIRLYARGDYPAVIDRLVAALMAGPAKGRIQERLLLARAYLHLDKTADAKAALESVLASDSENPEANFLMGQLLAGAAGAGDGPAHNAGAGDGPAHNKDKQAVEFLQHANRLKKTPATDSLLGQCYFRLGETAKAKEHLAAALKEDIRNPANSFLLGKIWLAGGAGAQAERYLLMAQEAGLDSVELHHLLGQAYLLQKKYVGPVLVKRIPTSQKAGDIVDDCVVLRKVDGQADQYLVCTRYCALYEGRELLNQVVPRMVVIYNIGSPPPDPTFQAMFSDAVYMLAVSFYSAGQYDISKELFLAKLEQVEPASKRSLDLQARFAIATKDFARLDKTLAVAVEKKVFDPPTVADFYYQAAVALRADGKRAEALAMLKKADSAVPTSANVLRALAALSVATDQLAEAKTYYARIVELFPDAADIDELRNTLRNLTEKTGGGHATTVPEEE